MTKQQSKFGRVRSWLVVCISGLMVLAAVGAGFVYMARSAPDSTLIEATGRGDIDFRVHYFENQLFPENPVPKNLHFLRHFTDYIEIDSSFSLWFGGGKTFDVNFAYTAEKRFEITYLGLGPQASPIVFQQNTEIARAQGTASGNHMSFRPYSGPDWPGGTYTVRPNDFMEIFSNFLEYSEQRLEEGVNLRGFSAELIIEFTLQLTARDAGLNEAIRRGYRIPIGVNVFSPEAMGNAGFTSSTLLEQGAENASPTVAMMGSLGAALAVGSLGLFAGLKKLTAKQEQNPRRQEYQAIMKKYGNEIVSSGGLADLRDFLATPVESFEELLKLSLNTGKLIVCHDQGDKAVFYVIADSIAFNFEILFTDTNPTLQSVIKKKEQDV